MFYYLCHWDPNGEVRPDIFEQLKEYSNHSDIAFVSASPKLLTNSVAMDRLKNICDFVLIRHNQGYDFGSWQSGILYCERYLKKVSRLILTNDSCYGPLHSFDTLFQRLMACSADVVGLTDSTTIRNHLQSYFIAYGQKSWHPQSSGHFGGRSKSGLRRRIWYALTRLLERYTHRVWFSPRSSLLSWYAWEFNSYMLA